MQLKSLSHLWGVNWGLILDDLQHALDPGISVWVSSGRPVEVKDHQFVCLSCQLEVGLQAADRLISCLVLVPWLHRAHCTKRIMLEERDTDITWWCSSASWLRCVSCCYCCFWQPVLIWVLVSFNFVFISLSHVHTVFNLVKFQLSKSHFI